MSPCENHTTKSPGVRGRWLVVVDWAHESVEYTFLTCCVTNVRTRHENVAIYGKQLGYPIPMLVMVMTGRR